MMNIVIETIKNRRSTRNYKKDQIKDAELKEILEAGIYAPSAHNKQSWHFTVTRDQELLSYINEKGKEKMAESNIEWVSQAGKNPDFHMFYHAPTVIFVSADKAGTAPLVDCAAAIENMLIAAESLNIGSCWIGLARFFFMRTEELPKLKLPPGYDPVFAVCLGYKNEASKNAAPRKEGVVSYL